MKHKKTLYRFLIFTSAVFVLFTFGKFTSSSSTTISVQDEKYPAVFPITEDDKEWIEKTISQLSLREKCAQMIMAPVYRSFMDTLSPDFDSTVALVKDYKIGGLIMFQGGLRQEIEFINRMQNLSSIPLLISADFERGAGMRIDSTLGFPHAMALGATLNSNYAYEMGKAIAEECRLIGVNQNFAPVADINNNELNPVINIRSFSESKYTVSEFASSFIIGTKHGRVISTAKHFPGHGDTEIDSHTELPVIKGERNYLFDHELYPFINTIEAGVQSIMIGHLEVPAFDTLPASLSQKIITNLLQKQLGFNGLIVTDAMNMDAILKIYDEEDAVLLSVKAGNDIILMPPNPGLAMETIYNAVLAGKITEERIDKSIRKILAAKRWLKIKRKKIMNTQVIINSLNEPTHKQLAENIADHSITLLKKKEEVIPLDVSKYDKLICITLTDGNGGTTATYFQDILQKRIGTVDTYLLTSKSKKKEYNDVLSAAKKSDLIILPVFMEVEQQGKKVEKLFEKQIKYLNKLIKVKPPVIVMSFKNPYLISEIPKATTFFNAYSYSKPSQQACLRALLGEIDVNGKLPVSIVKTNFVIGDGIELKKSTSTELIAGKRNQFSFPETEKILKSIIDRKTISNVELIIGFNGKIIYQKYFDGNNKSDFNLPFKLGTLTEPVVLTSAIMFLVEQNKLSVDDKVGKYINGFNGFMKSDITVKNLLLHNSGYGNKIKKLDSRWNKDSLIIAIEEQTLDFKPGDKVQYSIVNDIVLQYIIEKVSGKRLDEFIRDNLFEPLGMNSTGFIKEQLNQTQLASNKMDFIINLSQEKIVQNIFGGVTGFSNLSSTANDLAIFSQMLLQNGYYGRKQFFSFNNMKECISPQLPDSYASLGWQTYISESHISNKLSKNAFGFNSDNGSSFWIDPDKNLFIILLTEADKDTLSKYLPKIQDEIVEGIEVNHKE